MFGLFRARASSLEVHFLTDRVSVGPQIQPADITALARQGFAAIINVRPDGEMPGQPESARIEKAARVAGLAYTAIPVSGPIEHSAITSFRDALDHTDGPIFAYCRSGLRAVKLWALASVDQMSVKDICQCAAAAGYDLTNFKAELNAQASA